jgi:DNA-3-methyladenine glycosylase
MSALPADFYDRPVVEVARDLIGCVVEHDGAAGVIVETEAYHEREPACHAFVGRTPRTATLFGPPGRAYVYRSYGVHALLNAVCEPEGVGAAVLIRALAPVAGVQRMRARRRIGHERARSSRAGAQRRARAGQATARAAPASALDRPELRDRDLCSGPGKLTQALGIELADNGCSLARGPVVIAPARHAPGELVVGTRVGITRAAQLPWRFCLAGSAHVSSPRPRVAAGPSPWRAGARHGERATRPG